MSRTDIVVIQGFQPQLVLSDAKHWNKIVWYMPHSPTIKADEEKALANDGGGTLASEQYERIRAEEEALVTSADCVIFPSRNAATPYIEAFPRVSSTRTAYLASGTRPAGTAHRRKPNGAIKVLFAGRYVEHKGYDAYLSAAEQIIEAGPSIPIEFFTLGDGPLRRLSTAVTDLGWSDSPAQAISASDVIVVPNRVAYYDLLPLEVASLGRGMVMTSVGGNIDQIASLPDVIGTGQQDLARAILEATQLAFDSPEWGMRNAEAFQAHFTDQQMATRWLHLWREA